MSGTIQLALNHITAPRLASRAFIDLAAALGCRGVELRNDLSDKRLAYLPFFDGEEPKAVGDYARGKGIRLLGLSEVYGFNKWSEEMRSATSTLIGQAKAAGAESISLIPSNDGEVVPEDVRLAKLRDAHENVLPMLEEANIVALVEPLGFTTSSLRYKGEAIEAIAAVGGEHRFKLVHDTFHHFLSGEQEFFPKQTGVVHISSVIERGLAQAGMKDEHRVLVGKDDRLQNIEQIKILKSQGYAGHYSYECFAPSVHSEEDPKAALEESIAYILAST